MNNIIRGLDRKLAWEFAVGLLFLKKGLPRPDQSDLEKALQDTFSVLTTVKEVPTSGIPNVKEIDDLIDRSKIRDIDLSDLEGEVRRTVREVFDGYTITDDDLHKPYAPTVKANYVSTRSDLGTFGEFISQGIVEDLEGFEYKDIFKLDEGVEGQDEVPLIEVNPDFEVLYAERYRDVYEGIRARIREISEAEGDNVEVKLVALAEALKVRVISKGPPFLYFLMKPVQKFVHSIMRKHSTFALIGKPVALTDLEFFKTFEGDWLSVDYRAATDLLNPYLSACGADELCTVIGLPADLTRIFKLCLIGHKVEKPFTQEEIEKLFMDQIRSGLDPNAKKTLVDKILLMQLWGQLMGSVVSFLILCIVNAAICRRSYELGNGRPFRKIPLHRCPLLINGDDGLLRCNYLTKTAWEQLSSLGGLQPSIGKVYYHNEYLNINSTSFLFSNGVFEHLKYVNMGLVKGMTRSEGNLGISKVAGREASNVENFPKTVGSRHWELMDSCPDRIRVAVHRLFVKYNRDYLKVAGVPWWVPESMGGVGLKPFLNEEGTGYVSDGETRLGPSDLDLRCVRILCNKTNLNMRTIPTLQPVQARQVWLKDLPGSVRKVYELKDKLFSSAIPFKRNQEDLFSMLDSSAYYFKPSLVAKALKGSPLEALRANSRAWKRLTKIAKSQPNLPGFEVIKDSEVYRRAKFIQSKNFRLGRTMDFADAVNDRVELVTNDDIIVMDVDDEIEFDFSMESPELP